jgi:hypothetical protein
MASLASLLARDAIVSLDTIEQALQRQVLEGGELDTALLELAAVPENVLAAYRAASCGLPPVARAELDAMSPSLRARVPGEAAREHRVVPVASSGETLVLASAWPLSEQEAAQLEQRLAANVSLRITTELRLYAALARHYSFELGSRMRLLVERLEAREPGELCPVQPLIPTSAPPPGLDPGPAAQEARESSPRSRSSFPPERGAGTTALPRDAVRIVPVVRLGSTWPTPIPQQRDAAEPRPAKGSRPGIATPSASSRPARRLSGSPRGPLTRQQTIELLGQAHDRDRVLDVFFSFARQYFECTVLFALRDERLLGLDGSGLPSLAALLAVEVPISRTGALQGVVSTRTPRVVRLEPNSPAGVLAAAIGRGHAQPCALVPVVIRQRVVSLLYGDRGGEPIALAELSDLLEILPAVSNAFERIIQERKREAFKGRKGGARRVSSPGEPAPQGAFALGGAAPRATAAGLAPQPTRAIGAAARAEAGPPAPQPAAPQPLDDIAERPTMRLAIEDVASGMRRGSQRAPAPSPSHDAPVFTPRKRKEQDITRPGRPTKSPSSRASGTHRSVVDPPSPRTLSHPPAGTGSYAVREPGSELVDGGGASPQPAARPAERPAPERTERPAAGKTERPPVSRRQDPRREQGKGAAKAEVVSIPAAMRSSLVPPRAPEPEPESIAVDVSAEAERLVDELCRCGPDQEQPQVAALLRLGDAALVALERRFPGPLWFDRQKPRTRMPAGRDISAVARALFQFEERALPHIAALLAAPQTEARLCAAMLAADRVGPELLWPMYQRLFDPDGQVRLTAIESLPLFQKVAGFDDVLKSLRQKAAAEAEAVPNRLSALEAINALRDPGSIELLADLTAHASRQLSVPAHRTLIAVTAQDFGSVPRKWKAWIDKNRRRHRVEWLIDGLMHAEERVRSTAAVELQKLTQVYYGFIASAPKREREHAQQRYKSWWESLGRTQFGG